MQSLENIRNSTILRSFDEHGKELQTRLDAFSYSDDERKKIKRLNVGVPKLKSFIDPNISHYDESMGLLEEFEHDYGGRSHKSLQMMASVLSNYIYFNLRLGLYPFPSRSQTVLAYLQSLDRGGRKLNTIKQHRAQISIIHQACEWTDPCTTALVRNYLKNYSSDKYQLTNTIPVTEQAPAFHKEHLFALARIWHKSSKLMEERDLAVLTTAYATGLREGELSRIQYKHLTFSKQDGSIEIERTIGKKNRIDLEPKLLIGNYAKLLVTYLDRFPSIEKDFYIFPRMNTRGTDFYKPRFKKGIDTELTYKKKVKENFLKPLSGLAIDEIFQRAYFALYPDMNKRNDEMKDLAGTNIHKSDLDPNKAIWTGHSGRIGLIRDMHKDKDAGYTDRDFLSVGDWTSMRMVMLYLRNEDAESRATSIAQKRNDIPLDL